MRAGTGYLPGFSSSNRLVAQRPAGEIGAAAKRHARRLPRKLSRRNRAKIDRATRRLIRTLRPKSKGLSPEHQLLERAAWGISPVELAKIAILLKTFIEIGH